MHNIALIFVCLAIGIVLRWTQRLPEATTKVLGGWVINVALPAAALESVHGHSLRAGWWFAAATPWIGAALAIISIIPLCWAFGWSRQRAGALILVGGWGNTSFVGLPMISAFAGSEWLDLGIFIDVFGSYLALSTLGVAIAAIASAGRFDWRAAFKRILTFPPFIAILIAIATNDLERPDWLSEILNALSSTLTPLALAAVGYALQLDRISGRIAALCVGLGYRLLLGPLAIVFMYLALGWANNPVAKIAMLEMAMPPMLGATIIALDHDLEPDLVVLLISIGIPLSMLTAWSWWQIVSSL